MFTNHQPLSAYLVKPSGASRHQPSWDGFKTKYVEIRRYNPKLFRRSLVALGIWCAVVGTIQGFSGLAPVSSSTGWQRSLTASLASSTTGAPKTPVAAKASTLTSAVHAAILPGGPSGQLLPPGTMAADKTYPNSYARGQCTWYVAGRRQIPGNWGNAKTWYYHATASGWSVGTVPAVAAVAWTAAGYYGHVALVEQVSPDGSQVYVSEKNYRGLGVKSFRWVPSSQFKYIY